MRKADESEIPPNNKPSRRLSQYFIMIPSYFSHLAMIGEKTNQVISK